MKQKSSDLLAKASSQANEPKVNKKYNKENVSFAQKKDPNLKFKSRIGLIVPLVYLVLGGAIALLWLLPGSIDDTTIIQITGTCFFSLIILLFTWAVFSTYYILGEDYIKAVSGPFVSRILYKDITAVKPSTSAWSALALSIIRVKIERGPSFFKTLYISPRYRKEFIEAVQSRIGK